MQRGINLLISVCAPALIAAVAVMLEPFLTHVMKGRDALLPLVIMLLFSALVHPRLRHILISTLCYGVAFMAVRDAFRAQLLPSALDYDFINEARPLALIVVGLLAAIAAFGEALHPGTVWVRRCYFGAAGLYFSGIGVINFLWHDSWQSILLCATGAIALVGCVFAHTLVTPDEEEEEEAVNDDLIQQAREDAHHRTLALKEWQDTSAKPEKSEDGPPPCGVSASP